MRMLDVAKLVNDNIIDTFKRCSHKVRIQGQAPILCHPPTAPEKLSAASWEHSHLGTGACIPSSVSGTAHVPFAIPHLHQLTCHL